MTPIQKTEIADFITGFASRHGISRAAAIIMITTPAMSAMCERQMMLANLTTDARPWPQYGMYRGVPGLWTIVDYKPANWKNPWIVANSAGKRYKMTDDTAQRLFKQTTPSGIAVTPVPAAAKPSITAPPKRTYAGDF